MNEPEIRNAVIESVSLGYEDHGMMTAWVRIQDSSGGQGFGGYCLSSYETSGGKQRASAALGHFVMRCMEVVGVDAWEKLPGKPVRILGNWSKIQALGNYLQDKWFDPQEEFKKLEKEGALKA